MFTYSVTYLNQFCLQNTQALYKHSIILFYILYMTLSYSLCMWAPSRMKTHRLFQPLSPYYGHHCDDAGNLRYPMSLLGSCLPRGGLFITCSCPRRPWVLGWPALDIVTLLHSRWAPSLHTNITSIDMY